MLAPPPTCTYTRVHTGMNTRTHMCINMFSVLRFKPQLRDKLEHGRGDPEGLKTWSTLLCVRAPPQDLCPALLQSSLNFSTPSHLQDLRTWLPATHRLFSVTI